MAASERCVASSFRQLARVYTDIRASGSQSPRISFDENDQRPYVITYAQVRINAIEFHLIFSDQQHELQCRNQNFTSETKSIS